MDAWHLRILSVVIGVLAMGGSFTGCTSLGKTPLWGTQAVVVKDSHLADPAAAAPAGKYIVEFRAAGGTANSTEHNIAGPLNAHEALQQANAVKKFNRITIELVRPLPNGGWHRMPIEYDRNIRRVPAEYDYAVLPGDRLIVTEDTGNIFTDMMGSAEDIFIGKPQSGKTKNGTFRVAG